jgi:LAO/AO transport system kinase
MEIANIFVVNKADRDNADTLYRTLRILAHERSMHQEETPVIKTIATENNGVAELAAAIENYLTTYNSVPQKKLQLLTERCWQIIQHRRMAGYSKAKLLLRLQEAVLSPSFNLYSFADSVVENNG